MDTSDIDLMLTEKGNPCLSIVIPTQRHTKDRIENSELIENALLKATKLLANGAWPIDRIKLLDSKLDSILDGLDYLRLQEGLAIFISPNIYKIFSLPFLVREKVALEKTFEIRDLVYFSQFLKPYYLLAISKKRVRLFKGSGRYLQEITNHDFLRQYLEEYEYAQASVSSSSSACLKAFEGDKSVIQETRMRGFFKQTDCSMDTYLKSDMLLFIAGVGEELTSFEHISDHVKETAGKTPGNCDINAILPLAESAWKKVKDGVKASHRELLAKLEEDIEKDLATDGITSVWKAANEGKGLTLVLEKDYQVMAYQDSLNTSQIYLRPPATPHNIILDAADAIIEIVKKKNGDIVIVENGQLTKFNRIALLLRYK